MTEVATRRAIQMLRSFGYSAVYTKVIDHPPMITIKEADENDLYIENQARINKLANNKQEMVSNITKC